MVLRLTADEVMFLIQAVENTAIKGKDAALVAKTLEKLYKEIRPNTKSGSRPSYVILPSLDDARIKWNDIQEYEYDWNEDDEWECDYSSSDEDSSSDADCLISTPLFPSKFQ